jgi:hypothetical protein
MKRSILAFLFLASTVAQAGDFTIPGGRAQGKAEACERKLGAIRCELGRVSQLTISGSGITSPNSATFGDGTAATSVTVNGAAATLRTSRYETNGSLRWRQGAGTAAESGSNTGSPYIIQAFDDAGSLIGTPISITRATMDVDYAGAINLVATTTTKNSMNIPAGTLMTTPADGSLEADGNAIYATTDAGNRGYIPAVNMIRLSADYTLTSSTTEQKLFNATTNGRLTLEIGAYRFNCLLFVDTMNAASGNAAFDILGAGGATIGTALYEAWGLDQTTLTATGTKSGVFSNTAQSAASIVTAGTGTAMGTTINGIFTISAAGTIQPAITLVTANAAIVRTNSYCEFYRVGANSFTNIGQWD